MNAGSQTLNDDELSAEDRARANVYALIGRLFYDAPDSNLFAQICADGGHGEEEAGDAMEQAWRALQRACRSAYPAIVKQEYDTLFIGVGKAEVMPYTASYVTRDAPDRHLVMLREELEVWKLARSAGAFETEDHVSGLCDVMRFLIERRVPLADQRRFFERFVYPGAVPLCDAVQGAVSAVFYRSVALFAKSFFELEKTAFGMD